MKVFIVQNPVAGIHTPEKVSRLILERIRELGWDYELHLTTKGESVYEVSKQARDRGYDLFLVAGGDGTVSAVASAIIGRDTPMAIIPAGTGNGLARDLDIPMQLKDSLALLSENPNYKHVDAIQSDERFYLLNLSVGLTPSALKLTDRKEKQRLGRFAYILAGIRALFGIQPVSFMLSIDGKKFSFQASELLLVNSVSLGKPGRYLELGIENNDGVLDLFMFQSRTIRDYLRVFGNFLLRRPQADPDVKRFYVHQSIKIEGMKSLQVQADGDLIGYTPIKVSVIPQAVKFIVPKQGGN